MSTWMNWALIGMLGLVFSAGKVAADCSAVTDVVSTEEAASGAPGAPAPAPTPASSSSAAE